MDELIEITDSTLKERVKEYPLLIVDCWGALCPPCRILDSIIESLVKKYFRKVIFGKLNVDENKKTQQKYNITEIPTLLVFKEGELIDRITSLMPESKLESKIKSYLK